MTDDNEPARFSYPGRWLRASPGQAFLHPDPDDLAHLADGWPITRSTPDQVAKILAVGRRLFAHTWFVYDFGRPAVVWSMLAVEAALRYRLDVAEDQMVTLHQLVDRAIEDGILDPSHRSHLEKAVQLRNRLAHGKLEAAWSPGRTEMVLASAHHVVADLFPDQRGADPQTD